MTCYTSIADNPFPWLSPSSEGTLALVERQWLMHPPYRCAMVWPANVMACLYVPPQLTAALLTAPMADRWPPRLGDQLTCVTAGVE